MSDATDRLAFGPFSLSPSERLLTRDGQAVEIGGRSFDLLTALAEQPGRVVSKFDLLKRVWPDVTVEDGSLRFHMAGLRRILGDGENGARFISTQVGVGYAFVAPVRRIAGAQPARQVSRIEEETLPAASTNRTLPVRVSSLFGRDEDMALLTARFEDARLFTIVGPAGVGKTTLAIALAHQLAADFADATFVDLALVEDPRLTPSAIADALGVPVQSEDAEAVVLGRLRARRSLLVLDNCEHVIEAVSGLVERIGQAAPTASVLATSREPLRVRDEHVHWLGALGYPDDPTGLSRATLLAYPAIELFVDRAVAANSAIVIGEAEAITIAEMCARLDGMALPIELAAARAATHGIEATSRMLGERLSLGWTGRRTAQPRQQTLQAALDWSYELLSEPERRTFERLSVFVGPFSIDAAIEVVTDEAIDVDAAARALDALAAKSLMTTAPGEPGALYRLLEMTRAHAREKLMVRPSGEAGAAAARHARQILKLLHDVSAHEYGDLATRLATLSRQLGNIRAALDWSFGPDGDPCIAGPLAAASAPLFLSLSLLVECRTWTSRALAELDAGLLGAEVELELQASLGLSLMFTRGNSPAAGVALMRALDLAGEAGDRWAELRLLGRLHIFHERIGDFATARQWATRALAVADSLGDPEATAVAASLAGISHHLAGDQALARRELERALRQSLPSDRCDTIHYGFDHRNRSTIALARTLWLQGLPDQAKAMAERAVAEAAALDHPITLCIAMIWALSVLNWRGDQEACAALLESFAQHAELNAFGPYIAAAGGLRGDLTEQQGDARSALPAIDESLARLRSSRYALLTTQLELALTRALAAEQRVGEALAVIEATLERCRSSGEGLAAPELLRAKSRVLRRTGADADAEQLLLEAIDRARDQDARAWELRAAIDLAGLWIDQGRRDAARDLLRPVHASIVEGAGTQDMELADALLRRLQAAPGDPNPTGD